MKNKTVFKIISKKRAWYERLLAAVFFSITAYIIFVFYRDFPVSHTEKYYIRSLKILASLIILVALGIRFSYTINHHFDFGLMRYRIYYSVGPFGIGKWESIKRMYRVTTFLNSRNECEVSVWDCENKKYKIAIFNKIDKAVIFGRELAEKLKVKFIERK